MEVAMCHPESIVLQAFLKGFSVIAIAQIEADEMLWGNGVKRQSWESLPLLRPPQRMQATFLPCLVPQIAAEGRCDAYITIPTSFFILSIIFSFRGAHL